MTMVDPNDLDLTLLERYCSGTASVEEKERLEGWFSGHPEQRPWYETFKSTVRQGRPVMPEERVNTALAEFLRVVIERDQTKRLEKATPTPKTGRFSLRSSGWYLAIGCAMSVLLLAFGWRISASHLRRYIPGSQTTYTTYATTQGQRATITLPDSNTVVLNVGSRLEVPTNYGAGNHVVRLADGEALFTITHHRDAPFVVTAGRVTARVLGTSFIMRHYGTDTAAIVAVRDGKVAVGSTILTAHRLVEIGKSGTPHVQAVDEAPFTFATGTLTIDGLALPDAIVELDRWYNADIRLGDPTLAKRHVNASFSAGSVNELAENLGALYDVRVVREGRVLILNPR